VTEFEGSFAFVSPTGAGLGANRDEDGSGFCSIVGFSAAAGFGTNRLLKGFAAAALGFSCSVDDVGLGANRLPVAGAWNKVLGWFDAWLALLEKSDGPVVEEEKLIDGWDGVGWAALASLGLSSEGFCAVDWTGAPNKLEDWKGFWGVATGLGVDALKSEGDAFAVVEGAVLIGAVVEAEKEGCVVDELKREVDVGAGCSAGFAPNKGFDGV
jgi:hypothetical protein